VVLLEAEEMPDEKKPTSGAPRAGARGTCGTAQPAEAPVLLRQGFGGHPHSSTVGRPLLPAKAGESKHPFSCIKRGKIRLEVYGKEVVEWNSNGHNHR